MSSQINPSNIDTTFPIAGQDNDTQGFRTNYINIRNNFITAAKEITAIQANVSALTTATYGNTNVTTFLANFAGNISAETITTPKNTGASLVIDPDGAGQVVVNGVVTLSSAIQYANLTTAQIANISPTVLGMTVYNYNTGNIQVFNGSKWANITLS